MSIICTNGHVRVCVHVSARARERVCVCARVCRHALAHTRPDARVRKGLNRSNFNYRSFTCILINHKHNLFQNTVVKVEHKVYD